MADEEKPTNEDVADQPQSQAMDAAAASGDAGDLVEGTQEAVEAITKNVQERAAEIEDVLADASSPSALASGPRWLTEPGHTWSKPRERLPDTSATPAA